MGLPADQVGERRRYAAVGNMHRKRADLPLEQLHRQARERALINERLTVMTVMTGRLALTTSTLGVAPVMPMAVKSSRGS